MVTPQFIYIFSNQGFIQMKETELEIKDNPEKSDVKEITYRSFLRLFLMIANLGWGSFYFGYGVAYFGTFEFETIA